MKSIVTLALGTALLASSFVAQAANYKIDNKGSHAFIQFKISHLGYSWLYGRFNDFSGEYSYDSNNPAASKASVTIKTASVDTNHAERDKHLRSDDFFDVSKYPEIKFVSTKFSSQGSGKGQLHGNLTMHGVTKPITIDVAKIGEGKDPWGGYRSGFEGSVEITRADWGVSKNLGPASGTVEIILSIEGIRQ